MASENSLSSISAYSALLALPIGFFALTLTERGWNFLTTASRSARTTLKPSDGICARRKWEDLDDGSLHVCESTSQSECHGRAHERDGRCWERTLAAVVNHWNPEPTLRTVEKPAGLSVFREYLCVDLKVVLAFIFMAVGGMSLPRDELTSSKTLRFGDVTVEIQKLSTDDVCVLHLDGKLQRTLSKDYVERLLQGYPPLIEDLFNKGIFKQGDEARGGWVVALGLWAMKNADIYNILVGFFDPEVVFLPVYYDSVPYGDKRGHVFWRSMDRVRHIITNIWETAFDDEDHSEERDLIKETVSVLENIERYHSISWLGDIFQGVRQRSLSVEEEAKIITHFNGSPSINISKMQQFKGDWRPVVSHVLVAAVTGSAMCIQYLKTPGRELESYVPIDVLKEADIYLGDCRKV